MSLENKLETAFAKLLRDNEPWLADIPIRLTSLILAQTPVAGEDDEDADLEELPAPAIVLTARAGEESIPHTAIYAVDLTIAVRDNAQREGSDGKSLDALAVQAWRPLRYKALCAMLGAAIPDFICYGLPNRGEEAAMEQSGMIVTRSMRASFLCQTLEAQA